MPCLGPDAELRRNVPHTHSHTDLHVGVPANQIKDVLCACVAVSMYVCIVFMVQSRVRGINAKLNTYGQIYVIEFNSDWPEVKHQEILGTWDSALKF